MSRILFKKNLVKKGNVSSKKSKEIPIKKFLFSFLIAIVAYAGLIYAERSFLQDYQKANVLMAKKHIDEHTEFNKENVKDYFEIKKIPAIFKTSNSVVTYDAMIDQISSVVIEKGEIIMKTRLLSKSSVLKDIKDPMEVGFEVSDLSQVVGGTLRQGDIIDIAVVNNVTKENTDILQNVYISKVFDTNGKKLEKTQKDAAAVVLNVIIDSSQVQSFNEKITSGDIRVSRVEKLDN